MPGKVIVREGEALDEALRRFRDLVGEDHRRWYKRYRGYEKPSISRRKKRRQAGHVRLTKRAKGSDGPVPTEWHLLDPVFVEKSKVLSRCRFVLQRFIPYPALVPLQSGGFGWTGYFPYRNQPYDPRIFRLEPGGWDHEHCSLCHATIQEDDMYWVNLGEDEVDLCDRCHEHYWGQ
jgi:ribosomal protein S21